MLSLSEMPGGSTDAARPAPARRIVVAVGGNVSSERLISEGKRLADALACTWEAVHVETPDTPLPENREVAQLLAHASKLGASIATVPAGDVATGLATHLVGASAEFLILGASTQPDRFPLRRRWLIEKISAIPNAPTLLIVPAAPTPGVSFSSPLSASLFDRSTPRAHGLTLLLVALTLLLALSLQRLAGARVLDLLFLFPVITAAAQFGLRPALTAAVASVAAYNFFLTAPFYTLGLKTPQSILMAAVLVVVAIYTSIITGRLRSRLRLSDRSAAENARIAAFGQSLAMAADWEGTGQIVCDELNALLQVQAAVLRETEGKLAVSGAVPSAPLFSPLDRAALDWCWENGSSAGSGTDTLPSADWQFHSLKTSLGTLAVLAIAQPDGRNPVRADQAVLLSTLIAQAALAHERLRLEDQIRAKS